MTASPSVCPACGSPASGSFCSACGASLVARTCAGCRAELSPQARFCHRCGRPTGPGAGPATTRLPRRERTAWIVAGGLCVILLAAILFTVLRDAPAPVAPDMARSNVLRPEPANHRPPMRWRVSSQTMVRPLASLAAALIR